MKEEETEDWKRSVVGVFILPCRGKTEAKMNDEYLKKVVFEAKRKLLSKTQNRRRSKNG